VVLLFALMAVVLGIGVPSLSRLSATAADSSRSVATLPTTAPLPLTDAAARLRPTVPAGYRGPSTPKPTPTPAPAAASKPAAATATRSGAPATARPAPTAAPTSAPAGRSATATGAVLPLAVTTGSSTQLITVVAPSASATTAKVTAWEKGPNGWAVKLGPVSARIGKQGVGKASETTSRTPAGTFTLTEGFGRMANPGTKLSYRTINANDYWVSDTTSPLYNEFQECAPASCPFKTAAGEHLVDAGASYNYAVVIDYNRGHPVPGAGSAFFLHVTNGAPTAGCVAIDQPSLLTVMRWLNPGARPLIAIGVG
jgi:L,D-peptidoglycan transpeptidase YkuD (ErfK/YbiS/YcfS/YnhG family)